MRRIQIDPRLDWVEQAEKIGFTYHSFGQTPTDVEGVYWFEGAAYEFSAEEIDALETATASLHEACMLAVEFVIARPQYLDMFDIPRDYHQYLINSWNRRDPYLMGRFDLGYDPVTKQIKMLEYNADTPTLVLETALMQWFWLQEKYPNMDQFNSLHEKLLDGFAEIRRRLPTPDNVMHFTSLRDYPEERQHCKYFMDLATQCGIDAKYIAIEDIGLHPELGYLDLDMQPIKFLHKLYPWEWMIKEEFGSFLLKDLVGIVEPPWKMILSNKAILVVLSEIFPNHRYLLKASFDPRKAGPKYVEKPILAREGANIRIIVDGQTQIQTPGSYGNTKMVYQERFKLPQFDEQYMVIGSWVANGQPAGIVIRESDSPVVVNTSKVVPHYFIPK